LFAGFDKARLQCFAGVAEVSATASAGYDEVVDGHGSLLMMGAEPRR